jgi:hypothetical protein
MPKERGRDHERIEVGGTLDRLAVVQHESVHGGPFDDIASDTRSKPEFNKQDRAVAAPWVDLSA